MIEGVAKGTLSKSANRRAGATSSRKDAAKRYTHPRSMTVPTALFPLGAVIWTLRPLRNSMQQSAKWYFVSQDRLTKSQFMSGSNSPSSIRAKRVVDAEVEAVVVLLVAALATGGGARGEVGVRDGLVVEGAVGDVAGAQGSGGREGGGDEGEGEDAERGAEHCAGMSVVEVGWLEAVVDAR